MIVNCCHCGIKTEKKTGDYNRALKFDKPLFCSLSCFGLSRSQAAFKTREQKKTDKKQYDAKYRLLNQASLKVLKAERYQQTKNPKKERIARKARMHKHIEYCQRPEYKQWKQQYDKELRAKAFGDFAECYQLLMSLEKEIRSRASAYDIRVANGYYVRKSHERREKLCKIKLQTN